PGPQRHNAGRSHRSAIPGSRPDAEARRHPVPPRLGPAHVRPDAADGLPRPDPVHVQAQPARQAQGRAGRGAGPVSDSGGPCRVLEPAQRNDVRLQTPPWRPLASQAPGERRELTADDVRYSVERFLTVKGNPMAYMLKSVDRVDVVDRYTVKFVMKEPFSWLLEALATPMAVPIVARECVEKFGDLKKAEAVVGTGPWMLESHRPNVGLTFVRHPNYFVAGLPYIDRIEYLVDEDNGSRMAAFVAGKYDLGWEFPGSINRSDWVQIKD